MLALLRSAYGGEALFRPSSISRLLGGCLGSVQLIAHAPKEKGSSKFAQEGTAAHIVAEQALKGIRQPDEWTDRMVRLDDQGMQGWFVDAEMVEAIQTLLDQVAMRWTPTMVMYVEQRLTLAQLDPNDPILAENRGTGDIILVDIENGYIAIIDLKYGKGVMVPADTPQLKNYLLLALLKYTPPGMQWKKVETVIVQPRALYEHERIKPMLHDPAVIMSEFMGKLVESMYKSLEPDPPLVAGKHCHWCRAAAICPALQQEALHMGRDAHDLLPTMTGRSMLTALPDTIHVGTVEAPKPPQSGGVFLPMPEGLSPDECATIMDRAEIFDTWIKAVKHRAAVLLDRGIKVPGYKMVQRTGNRKWRAEVPATVDQLRKLGVSMSDMFHDPKLLSPAQMEKIMPKERRGLIAPLVERPLGGPTLVKETDRRQALTGFGMGPIEEFIESEATTKAIALAASSGLGPIEED